MNKRSVWTRRLGWGAAVVSASMIVASAPASAQSIRLAAVAAPSAAVGDTQQGGSGDQFHGYVGYPAGAVHEPAKKSEGLGPVGSNAHHTPDVPGATSGPEAPELTDVSVPKAPDVHEVAAVRAAIAKHGRARVTVMTHVAVGLEADLTAAGVRAQHRAIAASLDSLQATVRGTGSRQLLRFTAVPSAVYSVTAAGLRALLADPAVASVTLDRQAHGMLASSTGVIQSTQLNAAGVLGNNFEGSTGGAYEVAIIDSGVDGGHNAFTGRLVREACFVTDSSCPGNTNSSTAPGSGEECTHSSDCDHGTHVAGIAAGGFYTGGHEGVARGARIVRIKVAQDNPSSTRWTAFFSSIDNALQHVLNLRNGTDPQLVAVNISIGGGLFSPGSACNAAHPTTNSLMGQLQAAGVAVVVAAGNDGSDTQTSAPGCLSNAFEIGATDDSDVPASFTNSSSDLRWWAPGVSIDAPVPTGNNTGNKSGTSMSTPHVVGAFALLRECVDGNGVPQTNAAAAADLDATGVDVTRNGVTRKRINVLDAATRNVNNNDFAAPETLSGAGPINDFDFNVCADSEPGEPGPFSLDNSIWWQWTPPSVGTATISTEDNGSNHTTFDTTLTVYTGNTLTTLTPVAQDDDSGTGTRSLVTFPVNGGTTYRIKVDGFAAANGLLNLHVELGPPPQCGGVNASLVGTINGDNLTGTPGDDVIVAGDGNDTINGLDGNDRICTGTGSDTLIGGLGNDFLSGGPDTDTVTYADAPGPVTADLTAGTATGEGSDTLDTVENLIGSAFNDTLTGDTGNNLLNGANGSDTLQGRLGNDAYIGGAGGDLASFAASAAGVTANLTTGTASGEGTDTLNGIEHMAGSDFNDVLFGDALANNLGGRGGNDDLRAGVGNDRVDGGPGNDSMSGGDGNDLLLGRVGNDTYNGGNNTDTASFGTSPVAVNANLGTGSAAGEGVDTLGAIENMVGSPNNDTLTGNALPNFIDGRNGNDNLNGVDGNDRLDGWGGNDILLGGNGNDVMLGRFGADAYRGGTGVDTASFESAPVGVTANLTAGTAAGEGADVLSGVENITGSLLADNLRGNAAANRLDGSTGNDQLFGLAGNDLLIGGVGTDRCDGGTGTDTPVTCEVLIGIP